MPQPEILIIGDLSNPEFSAPIAWLRRHTRATCVPTIGLAMQRIERRPTVVWEAVILVQSRPGVFSQGAVESLHRFIPLARLFCLLGSWCEGESRSGMPLAGVNRLYWHQFVDRFERLWPASNAAGVDWSAPRTATDAEQIDHALQRPWPRQEGLIAVHADLRETYLALSDVLQLAGWSTVWWGPRPAAQFSRPKLLVWDSFALNAREIEAFEAAARRVYPSPSIVVAGFARYYEIQELHDRGAAAVVTKPFQVPDLLIRVDRLTREPSDHTQAA